MANIKNYPLHKIGDFLNYAYDKEIYERWLTLYPFMEAGLSKFISFKEYKDKLKEKVKQQIKDENISNEEILQHGLKIVQAYESQQKKEV